MPSPVPEPLAEQRGKFRSIASALDSLPLTKAQLWVMGLVMARKHLPDLILSDRRRLRFSSSSSLKNFL